MEKSLMKLLTDMCKNLTARLVIEPCEKGWQVEVRKADHEDELLGMASDATGKLTLEDMLYCAVDDAMERKATTAAA